MTANLVDLFLFAALPYLALAALVFGSIYRYRARRFTYSALSSQFLESRALLWGTVPFHIGILVLFVGHLVPFVAPRLWRDLTAHRGFLLTVEAVGIAAAVLAAAGLTVLLLRRVTAHKLQGVSTVVDLLVVLLLLLQVMVGLGVAVSHRWGAVWSVGTTTPYLWSLLALRPDVAYVAALPPLAKLHLVGAWVLAEWWHYMRWIRPLHLALFDPVGWPEHKRPGSWLRVPRDFAHGRDGVVVMLPPTLAGRPSERARSLVTPWIAAAESGIAMPGSASQSRAASTAPPTAASSRGCARRSPTPRCCG